MYKLVTIQDEGHWEPAIKLSETPAKTINPGHKQVWRVYDARGKTTADLLALDDEDPRHMERLVLHHPTEEQTQRVLEAEDIEKIEPLLVDIVQDGALIYDLPTIEAMRSQCRADLERLDPGVRRLINPHIYHVSLTEKLWNLKQDLVHAMQTPTQFQR